MTEFEKANIETKDNEPENTENLENKEMKEYAEGGEKEAACGRKEKIHCQGRKGRHGLRPGMPAGGPVGMSFGGPCRPCGP